MLARGSKLHLHDRDTHNFSLFSDGSRANRAAQSCSNTSQHSHRAPAGGGGVIPDHYWLDSERKEGKEKAKEVRKRRRQDGESDERMS